MTPMTEIDIADDESLRFVQRVLESQAPESDRIAARNMIVAIRTRVRRGRASSAAPIEGGMDAKRLDWLQERRETVYICSHQQRVPCTDGMRSYELRYAFDGWAVAADGEPHPTIREAIDAAMAKEPTK